MMTELEKDFVERYYEAAGTLQNLLADQPIGEPSHTAILSAGCEHLGRLIGDELTPARGSR